jgi:4-hydroxy-tetrahydrodipicolinate synthase
LRAGEVERARAERPRIHPLTDAIMSAWFIPAVKAAPDAAGFPVGSPREPLPGLDDATTARTSALVLALPCDLSLHALDDCSRTKHVMHNHGR